MTIDDGRLARHDQLLVGDDVVGQRRAGHQPGAAAGGDDDVVERHRLGAALVEVDLEGVVVFELAVAVDLGDLVLLHQEVHTGDAAVGDFAAAVERDPVVEGRLTADAELLGLLGEDVREFGIAQQRLRRDTAHVEAHPAPVLGFDDCGLQPELGGADRCDVSAWACSENNDVIVAHPANTNRAGSRRNSGLRDRRNRRRTARPPQPSTRTAPDISAMPKRGHPRPVLHHRRDQARDDAHDQVDQHDENGGRLAERVEPPVVQAQPDDGRHHPHGGHDSHKRQTLEVLLFVRHHGPFIHGRQRLGWRLVGGRRHRAGECRRERCRRFGLRVGVAVGRLRPDARWMPPQRCPVPVRAVIRLLRHHAPLELRRARRTTPARWRR